LVPDFDQSGQPLGDINFPVERKLHRFLDKVGLKKYSLVVIGNNGDVIRSQGTQNVNVMRGEHPAENDREDEDAEIKRLNLSEEEEEDEEFEKED